MNQNLGGLADSTTLVTKAMENVINLIPSLWTFISEVLNGFTNLSRNNLIRLVLFMADQFNKVNTKRTNCNWQKFL